MFEQAFKNIDDVLRKESGCTTELDYTEQTSWLLFLKYLDGLEQDKAAEASLSGKKYAFILDQLYRWEAWAAPKKSLAYVIAIMNLILHGIEAPNIIHTNTLSENLSDIQSKDQVEVILANPPFGGKERPEVQQNFPIRTGETAYLFLEHFIKMLKAGGRAGVVIKNTFLSNTDNASVSLRKLLLESCNLHTVLDCPGGTFLGAGVKTVVLFFEKGAPTRKIWYYQLDPGRTMGKTTALNDRDLGEFVELAMKKTDSDKSWTVDVNTVDEESFDLAARNPKGVSEVAQPNPKTIIDEIIALDKESTEIIRTIGKLL